MAEQQHVDERIHEQIAGTALKRRGILAAAGAVVAGIVAKQAAQPVAAAAAMQYADTSAPVTNSVGGETRMVGAVPQFAKVLVVDATGSPGQGADALFARGAGGGGGVVGVMAGVMIQPTVLGGAGVSGRGDQNGDGVIGYTPAAIGAGVYGLSDNNIGGRFSGPIGVYGVSYPPTATNGAGVVGEGNNLIGVIGRSNANYGVVGTTNAPGFSGLTGVATVAGSAALAASTTVANAYAAYFTGLTVVQGDFAVVGGNKSAAVKDASGQHRLVYCMELPESWFEDFGRGKLVNGVASVALDTLFTQIAHTDDYSVFLTPEDECNGLFVTGKTASGFMVRELRGGTSTLVFRYRVVAKRADIKGERLAKFNLPKINHPDPTTLPKPAPPRKR